MKAAIVLSLIVMVCGLGHPETDAVTVTADGKVGINAPSPAYQLDVGGTVRATGPVLAVGIVPVGAIVAFHPNIVSPPLPIAEGWQACDDSPITDPESPLYRDPPVRTPNLNGEARFLRGGSGSGTMQDDAMQNHRHAQQARSSGSSGVESGVGSSSSSMIYTKYNSETATGGGRYADETRPKNMSVVWIMRIK